ncbi:MAG TPA: hypothetical protein VFX89_04605 [Gammaproteobacteria bacterium]|nr:hypothetical protein [Gammaproteobacteria bacterium]
MSKIRVFVAAVLVSIPMLSLNAAQVQLPREDALVQMPQNAAPDLSDSKPTTADGGCIWINWFGVWFLLC